MSELETRERATRIALAPVPPADLTETPNESVLSYNHFSRIPYQHPTTRVETNFDDTHAHADNWGNMSLRDAVLGGSGKNYAFSRAWVECYFTVPSALSELLFFVPYLDRSENYANLAISGTPFLNTYLDMEMSQRWYLHLWYHNGTNWISNGERGETLFTETRDWGSFEGGRDNRNWAWGPRLLGSSVVFRGVTPAGQLHCAQVGIATVTTYASKGWTISHTNGIKTQLYPFLQVGGR